MSYPGNQVNIECGCLVKEPHSHCYLGGIQTSQYMLKQNSIDALKQMQSAYNNLVSPILTIKPSVFKKKSKQGWECPKCEAVMAPTTASCVNCKGKV